MRGMLHQTALSESTEGINTIDRYLTKDALDAGEFAGGEPSSNGKFNPCLAKRAIPFR